MYELVASAVLGSVVGFCLCSMMGNRQKGAKEQNSGFWYTLTFLDRDHVFRNIIAMFETRYINIANIAVARNKAEAGHDATLISMTYLGKDTIEHFTENLEERDEQSNNYKWE